MAKIDEWMLQKMVDMAQQGGRMEAKHEAQEAELVRLRLTVADQRKEIEEQKREIAALQAQLRLQASKQPRVVVNQFFLLSVPKTRVYVGNLDNDGRQFVGHMLHQTMPDDTPQCVIAQVDEMTQLKRQEGGGVVVERNYGPVNGNVSTQNFGMDNENVKQIEANYEYE